MSLLKKAGSTVVEYFEWDLNLLKVLSQKRVELLKYADNKRFSSEPDLSEYNKDSKPLHDLVLSTEPWKS